MVEQLNWLYCEPPKQEGDQWRVVVRKNTKKGKILASKLFSDEDLANSWMMGLMLGEKTIQG